MVVALGAHDVVGHLGRDTALELLVARQTAEVVGRHDTHSRWPDPEAVHSLGVAIAGEAGRRLSRITDLCSDLHRSRVGLQRRTRWSNSGTGPDGIEGLDVNPTTQRRRIDLTPQHGAFDYEPVERVERVAGTEVVAAIAAIAAMVFVVVLAQDVATRLAGVLFVTGALAAYVARRIEVHRSLTA